MPVVADLPFILDSANTVSFRSGTNAQTFRIYGTYTDASNGEWLSIQLANSRFEIAALANGTGTARAIHFITGAGSGNTRWNISGPGDFLASTDLTNIIGGYGANRPLAISTGAFAAGLTSQSGTTYTVATSDSGVIFTSATAVTVTLPAPASFTGRILRFKQTGAGAVSSASSNVVPLAGGAAGAAITTASGKFWEGQSDGTNWITMASN